jgi:hypothetical protein
LAIYRFEHGRMAEDWGISIRTLSNCISTMLFCDAGDLYHRFAEAMRVIEVVEIAWLINNRPALRDFRTQ